MQTVSWFSAGIVWRINECGELQFMVVEHRWRQGSQFSYFSPRFKFPGGKMDMESSSQATLERELFEETGLRIRPGARPRLVYSRPTEIPDEPGYAHEQRFYLLRYDDLYGELRDNPKFDKNSTLMPPIWVKAEGVQLYRRHTKAARYAVKQIMRELLSVA